MWFSFVSFHQITSEKYCRRCYRRRDLCRFNHPPSCFSGKRKQVSQHMVTGWMKCSIHRGIEWHCIDGPTPNYQAALVKKNLQSNKKQAKEITFQQKNGLHVDTAKSKVSQLKTGTFYWNVAMKCTEKQFTIKAALTCMERVWMQ